MIGLFAAVLKDNLLLRDSVWSVGVLSLASLATRPRFSFSQRPANYREQWKTSRHGVDLCI